MAQTRRWRADVLAAPGAATIDPARTFLRTPFTCYREIQRLDGGQVVSRTLEVKNRCEVATLGIVRIKTAPSFADITLFK